MAPLTANALLGADASSNTLDLTVVIAGLALVVSVISAVIAKHAITVSRENTEIAAAVPSVDAWADGLRTDLAGYTTVADQVKAAFLPYQEGLKAKNLRAGARPPALPEGHFDRVALEAQLQSSIRMRMDPDDDDHAAFLARLDDLRNLDTLSTWDSTRAEVHEMAQALIEVKRSRIPRSSHDRDARRPA